MVNDILPDDGPDDNEDTDWAEAEAQRAADEATVALRYELEHRQRFGNSCTDDFGDGENPW